MAFIDWRPELENGIRTFDDQHKKLIALINELHEAMSLGKGRQVIGSVLEELLKYTDYHFKAEEKAFDEFGYPQSAEHKRAHAGFIQKMKDLSDAHAKGSFMVTADTLGMLVDWLKDHIMGVDKQYAPFLAGKAK
jgi:hemerythrin-like metal-binding protein